jgi:hypothetical protein
MYRRSTPGQLLFEQPFDATMMVHFRQRLNLAWVGRINESVVQAGSPRRGTTSSQSPRPQIVQPMMMMNRPHRRIRDN